MPALLKLGENASESSPAEAERFSNFGDVNAEARGVERRGGTRLDGPGDRGDRCSCASRGKT